MENSISTSFNLSRKMKRISLYAVSFPTSAASRRTGNGILFLSNTSSNVFLA